MKTITMEDLGLKPAEVKELVEGAQKFLAPVADDNDDEKVTF